MELSSSFPLGMRSSSGVRIWVGPLLFMKLYKEAVGFLSAGCPFSNDEESHRASFICITIIIRMEVHISLLILLLHIDEQSVIKCNSLGKMGERIILAGYFLFYL